MRVPSATPVKEEKSSAGPRLHRKGKNRRCKSTAASGRSKPSGRPMNMSYTKRDTERSLGRGQDGRRIIICQTSKSFAGFRIKSLVEKGYVASMNLTRGMAN